MIGATTVCWVCQSDDTASWRRGGIDRPLTSNDLKITDDGYGITLSLRRCGECGFIFAVGDDLERLPRLYERLVDPGYFEGREARALQMQWLMVTLMQAHPTARTLLDVGAGTGLLVAAAQRCGLTAVGVEPSQSLVDYAARTTHIDLMQGSLPHPGVAGRTFDIVCLIDVLEHVTDPVAMLLACADVLSPTGILVVVTPDAGSAAARIMGRRWWHFRLAHVGYFTKGSLRRAAAEAGLTIVSMFTARWFFKVRYLAERITHYVPIQGVNRLADRLALLRRLYERIIPLNFHDSVGLVLRRDPRR